MIRSVIEDLGYPYSAKDKEFYIERYEKILGLLPKIRQGDVGLEVGLAGGILAITVRRMFGLKRLYALEHPAAVKQFSRRYLGSLKKEKIIPKNPVKSFVRKTAKKNIKSSPMKSIRSIPAAVAIKRSKKL